MEHPEGFAALSTSLAALSMQPRSAATPPRSTADDTLHTERHSHTHTHVQQQAATAPAAPTPAPAPFALPTLTPPAPSSTARDCLRHFLDLQEYRALTYSAWQSGFRHYLACKQESDLLAYTAHCQHATTAFQQLSLHVKLCIARLHTIDAHDWAAQLEEVQRLEREKLGLTVAMQELSSEWVVRRKEEFSGELQEQLLVRRRRMDEVVEAINDILTEAKYEVRYRKQQ